jgi:uncharacterized RDD family membrane protein YckC
MDQLTIETPEQIPLEFPLAGIGSRFLALALDTLIQIFAGVALGCLALVVVAGPSWRARGGVWALAVFVLLAFLVQFGYFALFEAIWNGQTPGKRWTHLRVIQDSGRPISVYEAVARNLLRIVDSLPMLYGLGILSALLSSRSKRLGDYVAGTVVVHEKPTGVGAGSSWDLAASAVASRYDVARISPEEFQLIERFLLRRNQLVASVRIETARRITQRLADRLGFSPDDQRNPEALLEALATAYREGARFRRP